MLELNKSNKYKNFKTNLIDLTINNLNLILPSDFSGSLIGCPSKFNLRL